MSTNHEYIFTNAHAFKPDLLVESLVILPDAEKNRLLSLVPDETIKKFIFVKLCDKLLQDGLTIENLIWIDSTITDYCSDVATTVSDTQREVAKQNLINLIMQVESLLLSNLTNQDGNVANELQLILTDKLQLLAKSDLSSGAQKRLEQILKANSALATPQEKLNHIIEIYDKISPRDAALGKALFSVREELELELNAYNRAQKAPVFQQTSHLSNLPLSQFLGSLLQANNKQRKVLLGDEDESGKHAQAIKAYRDESQFNIANTREFLAKALCQKPAPTSDDINWIHDYLETVKHDSGPLDAWNMILDMRLDTCYPSHRSPGLERLDHMLFSMQNNMNVPQKHWNLFKPQQQVTLLDADYKTLEAHILDKFEERLAACKTEKEFEIEIDKFQHSGHASKIRIQVEYEARYEQLLSRKGQIIAVAGEIALEKPGYEDQMIDIPPPPRDPDSVEQAESNVPGKKL